MILFGGWTWIGPTRTLLNHVEYYDPFKNTWSTGPSGVNPNGRQSPAVTWDSNRSKMFIFGGNDGSVGEYKDAWYG